MHTLDGTSAWESEDIVAESKGTSDHISTRRTRRGQQDGIVETVLFHEIPGGFQTIDHGHGASKDFEVYDVAGRTRSPSAVPPATRST